MKIVFVGDSITASGNWSEVINFAEVENFAVPGGTTDGLLEAIPEICTTNPDVLSILIGTNDFGNPAVNREGADVGARVLAIIHEFRKHLPNTKIILHTILPRGVEASGVDLRPRVVEANKFLYSNVTSDFELIDLWPLFVALDGLSLADEYVMPDEPELKLHINKNGYREWESTLLPILQRMVSNRFSL